MKMSNYVGLLLALTVQLCYSDVHADDLSSVNGLSVKACLSCYGETCSRVTAKDNIVMCYDDCVAIFNGFTLVRKACYTFLSESEKAQCDSGSEYTCYKCGEDRCNYLGRVDHKCLTCSSESDSNCLHSPAAVAQTRCSATGIEDVQCYVKVVNSTSTERGCITTMREIRDCENDRSRCSLCPVTKDGACNTYDYPTARRRCVECRGGQQCASLLNTAISIDRASSFCENPSDACISINNRGNYTMACAATLTRYEQLFCAENPSSCTSCSSNNCIRLLPPPPEPINCPTTGSSATAVIHHAFLIGLGGLFLIV